MKLLDQKLFEDFKTIERAESSPIEVGTLCTITLSDADNGKFNGASLGNMLLEIFSTLKSLEGSKLDKVDLERGEDGVHAILKIYHS